MKNRVEINSLRTVLLIAISVIISLNFFACDDPGDDEQLLAPSDIMLTVINDHTLQLTWQDNSDNEDGFKIARKSNAMDEYEVVATVGANTTTYSDDELLYTNIYYYKVAAYKGGETSSYSSGIIAPTEFPPPLLEVTPIHETKLSIDWEDIWDYDVTFELYRRDTLGYELIASLPDGTTSYLDENRTYALRYIYTLVAITDHNRSGMEIPRGVSTKINPPTDMDAQFQNSKNVKLTWNDNCAYETENILEYNDGSGYIVLATLAADTKQYTHQISSTGNDHHYRIQTNTENYSSDYSEEYLHGAWFDYSSISAGSYTFGEAGDTLSDLQTDFQMLNYEVTNYQYLDYLNFTLAVSGVSVNGDQVNGNYVGDANWPAGSYLYYGLDAQDTTRIYFDGSMFSINQKYINYPVNHVSWFGAYGFAEYHGVELPTENEWEKAARGMTGEDYPWSGTDVDCDDANYAGCGGRLGNVGGTTENQTYGELYDMIGNVAEWTDSYPATGSNRVTKGGSYLTSSSALEAWRQGSVDPTAASADVGFRVIVY